MNKKKLNILGGIICLIDPWCLQILAQVIGLIFYLSANSKRKIAQNNIQVVTGSDNRELAVKIFINIVMNILEFLRVWKKGVDDILPRSQLLGLNNLNTGKDGLILVTAHIGIWDIAARYIANLGYKIAAVVEFEGVSAAHYDFMLEMRGYPEVEIFPLEKQGSSARILRFLKKQKGILALLADRDLNNTGLPVKFFNQMVKLPVGPARLAVKLNIPVVIGYVIRLKSWKYLALVSKPYWPNGRGNVEEEIKNLHEKIAKSLENVITKYPDQWLNFYPPWKMDEE